MRTVVYSVCPIVLYCVDLETERDGLELKAHLGTVTHDDQNPDAILPLEITILEIRHPEEP